MSFLSNYEGQGCGATSKDRPTYPSPPALSSCSHIPLVSSGSALWSKLSIPNKSSPPQLFQFAELFTFSCWVSPSTPGEGLYCVWSLFSVSTRCLWTPVKVCVKDWAVNWKLWVRAGSLALRAVPVLLLQTCWDDKQRVRRHLCSVIKNNGIVCRMRGGIPETLNWFYLFVFSLSCRFHYGSMWSILKRSLLCFETENPQQPLRRKTSLWFEVLCWKRHVLFHFQNEHATL